jgi:Putative zincin peptidase
VTWQKQGLATKNNMLPGFIIAWLTFPGVIIHELAHKLFCQWTGTVVRQVCYFRFSRENPVGFVIHGQPSNIWKLILIGTGPLFINTSIGLGVALLAFPFQNEDGAMGVVYGALIWLAISIAMHSFPSKGDAQNILHAVWEKKTPLSAKIVGEPLAMILFIGAYASIFWLDLLYGIGVVIGIPSLFHLTKL